MQEINKLLNDLDIKPLKYIKKNNIYIVETKDNKYVIKKSNKDLYEYLISRDYHYIPKIKYLDKYIIYEYEDDLDIPKEEKILDIVYLVSLLHKKTCYYKNITQNDIKEIYEDILGNINFLKVYYDVLMTSIETKEIMNPAEYYLARNISLIYNMLDRCYKNINDWYKKNEQLTSMRYTMNHNNLKLNHLINHHLISFEKATNNLPIYDLYKFYKETYNITDWYDIYLNYNKEFKLTDYEQSLLFILLLIPNKIEFKNNEYDNTLMVSDEIEYLNKTVKVIDEITKK